jgi:uncharacterized protein (DUF362 family)
MNGSLYNVTFIDNSCRNAAGWSSNDPNAYITFSQPPGIPQPPPVKITDVLINASYLINIPIMKKHSTGATLGFKNHFGTIGNPSDLHEYVLLNGSYFSPNYNPLVDLYKNPHIGGKTILTIGDGLFAAKYFAGPPELWVTFGNQVPKSLFFSTDPVAIDCVMCDFLKAEMAIPDATYYYLQLAGSAGLGVFESGTPWGSGYNIIDYQRIEI